MFEQLAPRLWRFHDDTASTSSLVVGDDRAAMIDCGSGHAPVMPMIREITPLPVDLLLTHAHPDHYGAAAEFERVYLHERDAKALGDMEPVFTIMGVPPLPRDTLHTFTNGHVFDLGGRSIRAIDLPGHTPGSVVFADDTGRALFSGDAVGSGDIVLMSVPKAYTLSRYRDSLRAFLPRIAPYKGYAWYAGHCHQSVRADGTENPVCPELIADMAALCDALLAGEVRGAEVQELFAPGQRSFRAYLGRAGVVFAESQLA